MPFICSTPPKLQVLYHGQQRLQLLSVCILPGPNFTAPWQLLAFPLPPPNMSPKCMLESMVEKKLYREGQGISDILHCY